MLTSSKRNNNVNLSVSLPDCKKLFNLTKYTPEELVEPIFGSKRTKPIPKEEFIQLFQAAFGKNVAPEHAAKVAAGILRIYEVCVQDAPEITVDDYGKGIGVFTNTREDSSLIRDLFFKMDKQFNGVIELKDLKAFLDEAASKGVLEEEPFEEVADLKKVITRDKGKMELTYWTCFVWKTHPAIRALLDIYVKLRNLKKPSPTKKASLNTSREYPSAPEMPQIPEKLNNSRDKVNGAVNPNKGDKQDIANRGEEGIKSSKVGRGDRGDRDDGLIKGNKDNRGNGDDRFNGNDRGQGDRPQRRNGDNEEDEYNGGYPKDGGNRRNQGDRGQRMNGDNKDAFNQGYPDDGDNRRNQGDRPQKSNGDNRGDGYDGGYPRDGGNRGQRRGDEYNGGYPEDGGNRRNQGDRPQRSNGDNKGDGYDGDNRRNQGDRPQRSNGDNRGDENNGGYPEDGGNRRNQGDRPQRSNGDNRGDGYDGGYPHDEGNRGQRSHGDNRGDEYNGRYPEDGVNRRNQGDRPQRSNGDNKGDGYDGDNRRNQGDRPQRSNGDNRGDGYDGGYGDNRRNQGDRPQRSNGDNKGDGYDGDNRRNQGDRPQRSNGDNRDEYNGGYPEDGANRRNQGDRPQRSNGDNKGDGYDGDNRRNQGDGGQTISRVVRETIINFNSDNHQVNWHDGGDEYDARDGSQGSNRMYQDDRGQTIHHLNVREAVIEFSSDRNETHETNGDDRDDVYDDTGYGGNGVHGDDRGDVYNGSYPGDGGNRRNQGDRGQRNNGDSKGDVHNEDDGDNKRNQDNRSQGSNKDLRPAVVEVGPNRNEEQKPKKAAVISDDIVDGQIANQNPEELGSLKKEKPKKQAQVQMQEEDEYEEEEEEPIQKEKKKRQTQHQEQEDEQNQMQNQMQIPMGPAGQDMNGNIERPQLSNWLVGRRTNRIASFEDFLILGMRLGLHNIPAKEYITRQKKFLLANNRNKGGNGDLTIFEFIRFCVENFMKPTDNYYEFTNAIIQLFQFMDINNNGILELAEALQGIIHLFGGTEEDKICAAFMLFDLDESGFIGFSEVLNFVLSTIKLTNNQAGGLSPEKEEELKQIAYATATDLFETMDLDHNGQVSLEEFLVWFRNSNGNIKPKEMKSAKEFREKRLEVFNEKVEHHRECEMQCNHVKPPTKEELELIAQRKKASAYFVSEVRSKIPFERIHIQLIMQHLKGRFLGNTVNCNDLVNLLREIVKIHELGGEEYIAEVAGLIFNALDEERKGIVSVASVAIGLSLICGGCKTSKMKAAFDIFDENDDKTWSFSEALSFMGTFFSLISHNNPVLIYQHLIFQNGEKKAYAEALTLAMFQESGVPLDGALEFHAMKQWAKKITKK